MDDKIVVYTDGACIGNGSSDAKGGWACKLMYKGYKKYKSGHESGTTNNRMEMTAVLEAMKSITDKGKQIELYSDSQYVIRTLKGEYKIGENQELWDKLMNEYKQFPHIELIWVKGHHGNLHNDDVDSLAYQEARNVE